MFSQIIRVTAIQIIAVASLTFVAHAQPRALPLAPIRPVVDDYFGTKIADPYRWMEDMNNPELLSWMKTQDAYTRTVLNEIPGRQGVMKRLTELTNAPSARVSSVRRLPGNQYVYLKTNVNENIASLYIRKGLKGKEIRLVDPQALTPANGQPLAIRFFQPSWDGKLIAVGLEPGGSENLTYINIYDVVTGRKMNETIERITHGEIAWLSDNRSFFYTRRQQLSPNASKTELYQKSLVHRHIVGTSPDKDQVVFGYGVDAAIDVVPTWFPRIQTFAQSPYVLARVETGVGGGQAIYLAQLPKSDQAMHKIGRLAWRKICSAAEQITDAAINGNDLYLVTHLNTPRYKVIRTNIHSPNVATATVVVPPGDAVIGSSNMAGADALHIAEDALYVQQLNGGLGQIQRIPFQKNEKSSIVKLPFDGTLTEVQADSRVSGLLFSLASWTKAPRFFAWSSALRRSDDLGLQPRGPYDELNNAEVREVMVKSADGTAIPLSIIYKKGIKLDGTNPTWLNGYGAYGIPTLPNNNPVITAWVEHGGIYAVAHVRGGGEFGDEWHQGGFQATKPNTWLDFIACAEFLIKQRYTSSRHLGGSGISAGGILIGRAITERPDLFRAVGIVVGLSDMLRFETTANGVPNIPEFGSVKTREGFRTLHQMSAYHHVKDSTHYPAVLLATGINDPRVDPWMTAKMAARLQAATISGRPVILRVDYQNGHGPGVTKRQRIETYADGIAFLFWQLGHVTFQPPWPGCQD
ncbi:prolyl oligopeptidase family serine peptidase [Larkinella soli]|uniref:prolyl oligopeptidase family serine peptidase n=1 Tax=Larkinella soli TaxID=1770527 RepID=UPI000FFBF978|nr:prolyl oligopeptidase family serine peptidase [Larkinella soli]